MGRPVTIVFSTEEGTDLDGLIALNVERNGRTGSSLSNAAATTPWESYNHANIRNSFLATSLETPALSSLTENHYCWISLVW
jgi:hypothetical protein